MLFVPVALALAGLSWWAHAPWLAALAALGPLGRLRGPGLANRLGLVALSLAATLVAVELYLARTHPLGIIDLDPGHDRRTRAEVVAAKRAEGFDAFRPTQPSAFVKKVPQIGGRPTLPLGGISGVTMVHCNSNEAGQYVVYTSDEHGLANPPGLWDGDPVEVAFVGDSFTHGACVSPSYPDLVREVHPRTLNLGRDGNGPLLELASLREFLPAARPRHVLWCYYEGNDARELNLEKQNDLLLQYLEPGFQQGLLERQPEVDDFLRRLSRRREERSAGSPPTTMADLVAEVSGVGPRLRLEVLRRVISPPAPEMASRDRELDEELFERILREARATVEGWDGQLWFVYITGFDALSSGRAHPNRAAVLAVVERIDLPLIDTAADLLSLDDPLSVFPHRRPGHYEENGVRRVADLILGALSGGQ